MINELLNIGVTEHYLPEVCYSKKPLPNVYGTVIHGYSAKNISKSLRYDKEMCWELMRDLNYPKNERLYTYKRPQDPEDRSFASAHLMFHRNGDCEILVPLERQAYHAGASTWEGKVGLNKYFLGAEFVTSDGDECTDEQYTMAGQVFRIIMNYHALDLSDLPGHYQVSPSRKTDPWPKTDVKKGFDWGKFYDAIRDEYEGAA